MNGSYSTRAREHNSNKAIQKQRNFYNRFYFLVFYCHYLRGAKFMCEQMLKSMPFHRTRKTNRTCRAALTDNERENMNKIAGNRLWLECNTPTSLCCRSSWGTDQWNLCEAKLFLMSHVAPLLTRSTGRLNGECSLEFETNFEWMLRKKFTTACRQNSTRLHTLCSVPFN